MPDFTVARRGTDTSGRAILSTTFFWTVWQLILAEPRIDSFRDRVIVVQGAFMARLGGGAAASAGYHDQAGCWDVRTWNLSDAEEQTLWDVAWAYGVIFWKRDLSAAHGGMDEHGHGLAVWDSPLASGAAVQRTQAFNGRDGLASNNPDYMRRPSTPLPHFPPKRLLEEDYLMTDAAKAQLDKILSELGDLSARVDTIAGNDLARDRRAAEKARASKKQLVSAIGGLADQLAAIATGTKDDATAKQLRAVQASFLQALADDPDVDGPDNPDPTKLDQEEN